MTQDGNRETRGGAPKRRPGISSKPGRIGLGRRAIVNANPKKGTRHECL